MVLKRGRQSPRVLKEELNRMLKMEVLEEKLDCPPIQKEREREIEGKENKNFPLLPNEK